MNSRPSAAERDYLALVKSLPCSLCDALGPSEAHHMDQKTAWTCIALCTSCHRGPVLGLHGQRRMWAIKKLSELDALAMTIRRAHAMAREAA